MDSPLLRCLVPVKSVEGSRMGCFLFTQQIFPKVTAPIRSTAAVALKDLFSFSCQLCAYVY